MKKEPTDEDEEGDLVIDLPPVTKISESSDMDAEENVLEKSSEESSSEEDVEEEFSSQEEENRAQDYELEEVFIYYIYNTRFLSRLDVLSLRYVGFYL